MMTNAIFSEQWQALFYIGTIVILYAEIHYSIKGIYSRLKMNEPEIIADVPHRINPGMPIPVLILIKDAHRYPVILRNITIMLSNKRHSCTSVFSFDENEIRDGFWHTILYPGSQYDFRGSVAVNVRIEYLVNGNARCVHNDNYKHSKGTPFTVFISSEDLPRKDGWYFGEVHCHTSYTSDQVEFGAPLPATQKLARSMGLNFFCATDHSYDLDDTAENYLIQDPNLQKWTQFQNEVNGLNQSNSGFFIIPGEEVSAGNSKDHNVHFLVLNHPVFLPGNGDSAEKWLRTKPTLSIKTITESINSNSVAIAAHPAQMPSLLERILVRRGRWEDPDYDNHNLHSLQIWNGSDHGFAEGKKAWIKLLLQGRKIFICAGNDAHGNFNRYRQIGLPFVTMRENHQNLFGKVRTGVYIAGPPTLEGILDALRTGSTIVTDGPFLDLYALSDDSRKPIRPGGSLSGKRLTLNLNGLSTREFGKLSRLVIYFGCLQTGKESLLQTIDLRDGYDISRKLNIRGKSGYFRAELYSKKQETEFKCLTNPIWWDSEE